MIGGSSGTNAETMCIIVLWVNVDFFLKLVAKVGVEIGLVSFIPLSERNRGSFCFPCTMRYFTIASTGHIPLLILG